MLVREIWNLSQLSGTFEFLDYKHRTVLVSEGDGPRSFH